MPVTPIRLALVCLAFLLVLLVFVWSNIQVSPIRNDSKIWHIT